MADPATQSAPNPSALAALPPGRRVTLDPLIRDLATDGLINKEDAERLLADRRINRADHHPLVALDEQKLKDPRNPRKLLHLEMLTEWMAEKVGMPYLHIDPFKIDFGAVTKLMSTAYAQRYRILPVGVNAREVTIATCEPFVRDWEESLKQILRLDIKRVIANPLRIDGQRPAQAACAPLGADKAVTKAM